MSRRKKKKTGVIRKSITLAFGIVGFAILAVYLFFGFYFQSHFFFQTRLADIDVSGMTAEEAAEEVGSEVKDYLLTIYDRNGNKYQILGVDIDYNYQPNGEEEKLLEAQKSFLWPKEILKNKALHMDKSITYSEEKLKEKIHALSCFKEENMIEPENASIEMTEEGYELVPETQGSYLLADKVYTLIKASVDVGETELVLSDEVYKKPEVTTDDKVLSACMNQIQAYFGAQITYDMGDTTEIVDKSVISQWITVDEEYNVIFDEDAVAVYVQGLATKYNTYGDVREFKTSKGDTVSIGGGDYGWVIDKEAEKAALIEELKNGEVKTREPVYSQTALAYGANDIGDTYIEIDYTNQHLWYYEKGKLKAETDIVSGNINRGNGSPDGVFKIVYKKSPAVLKGEDYESDVTYFMPFAYNVGIHDASWRNGKFGGVIYKTSGSHGCINVPKEAADKLYEIVATGTPVIAYYREEVYLTAENTKISNAYSYIDPDELKALEAQKNKNVQETSVLGQNESVTEDGSIAEESQEQ
ncbi:MAG: peptidoglycan binding domain-containing protein [Lachnospiraceae bacterium]|nr:peptidoglycan binding domain-containing protein [Lachnospiraceae bacterium]